jgi:molybdopterin-guanine dinucleotide biosynthesis protein A
MRMEYSVCACDNKFDALNGAEYDQFMEQLSSTVSGIILAGGQSRRMGRDKALIDFQGKPIIAHVIATLRTLSQDVVVVSNRSTRYDPLGARVAADYDPPCGPLGGIAAGLQAMDSELAIVVACDMPFLNVSLLRWLIGQAEGYDAVVPQTGDEYEPLHAIYRRTCYNPIVRRIEQGDRRVISFFADVRLRTIKEAAWRAIDPAGRSLVNLNTPGDLSLWV